MGNAFKCRESCLTGDIILETKAYGEIGRCQRSVQQPLEGAVRAAGWAQAPAETLELVWETQASETLEGTWKLLWRQFLEDSHVQAESSQG